MQWRRRLHLLVWSLWRWWLRDRTRMSTTQHSEWSWSRRRSLYKKSAARCKLSSWTNNFSSFTVFSKRFTISPSLCSVSVYTSLLSMLLSVFPCPTYLKYVTGVSNSASLLFLISVLKFQLLVSGSKYMRLSFTFSIKHRYYVFHPWYSPNSSTIFCCCLKSFHLCGDFQYSLTYRSLVLYNSSTIFNCF